jgi:hypothetical protein
MKFERSGFNRGALSALSDLRDLRGEQKLFLTAETLFLLAIEDTISNNLWLY